MPDAIEVCITPLPITGMVGCCVPVIPGTPIIDVPMEQRTERCGVDAHWIVGAAPCCDIHAEAMCIAVDWDWPEFWQEAGRSAESVAVPWADRQRHSQEDTEALTATTEARKRTEADALAASKAQYRAIRNAVENGANLREVAEAVGLSHQMVHRIATVQKPKW